MKKSALSVLASIALIGSVAVAQQFNETGGTYSTSNWGVDRFAPAIWDGSATAPNGDAALRTGVSNADRRDLRSPGLDVGFFDYQGRQRNASISGAWEVGAQLYIPATWMTAPVLRDSSLWVRDSGVDANFTALYPTFGFSRSNLAAYNDPNATLADISDPLHPGVVSSFYGFDSFNGDTELYAVPVNVDGWNSFRIVDNGVNKIEMFINNVLVKTYQDEFDSMGVQTNTYSGAGFQGLTRVFLQNVNFGNATNLTSLPDASYNDAFWRNVYAVPTPGATGLLGMTLLVAARRRRN
jgi:hypothetical protein